MATAPKRESVVTRGYDRREMKRIEKEIAERNAEWLERFDAYLESLVGMDTTTDPEKLVERAEKLADFRLQRLLLRQRE